MAKIISENQIVTRWVTEGLEDLAQMKKNKAELEKGVTIKVNADTKEGQKNIADYSKSVSNLSNISMDRLKKGLSETAAALTPLSQAIKNLPTEKVAQLDKLLEGTTDEFKVLGKQVEFMKNNMDKLNLKPKEFKDLQQSLIAADQIVKQFGTDIEQTGQKNLSLRGKLAGVRNELTLMDQAGKTGTQAYKNLQVQAGKLQDEIDDNRAAVKALSSDTLKLDAGVGAIRGLVAGFTAYQGILGLAGVNNKEFEKTLLKINGAMAVLQGLQEITNLLQAQSATRLVASSIAQGIWNSSIAFSNKLLGIKIATEQADAVALEEQAVATELSTAATNTATVSAGAFTIALATTLALIAAIGFAIYTAVDAFKYFTSNMLKTTEEIDKENEGLLKTVSTMETLQKIRKGGLNDLNRELDLIKSKGGALDEIYKKEKQIADQEIKDAQARLDKLNSLPGLTPTKLLEIKKVEDEIRAGKEKTAQLDNQFTNNKLAQDAKIHQQRIDNIKDEYKKSIESIKAQRDEDIRLNNLNQDQTGEQRQQFKKAREQKAANDIEKINIDSNKKVYEAYLELTQNKYDKEVEQIRHKASEDIRINGNTVQDKAAYAIAINQAAEDKIKELDKKAQLDISNLHIANIKDEYDRKIKQLEAVNEAQKKAFIGSAEATKAYAIESDKQLYDAKEQLAKDREQKLQELRTSLIVSDYARNVQAAQDAYYKDLANYSLGEDKKGEYTLLIAAQLNNKLQELQKPAIKALADIHIANIENQYDREKALAIQKGKEDIESFKKQIDQYTPEGKKKLDEFEAEVQKRIANLIGGQTIFGKLFGLDKQQEAAAGEAIQKSLTYLTQSVQAKIDADQAIIDSEQAKYDRLKELAEFGSAEALKIQGDHLAKVQAQKEKDVQKQKQLAAIQIAINNAISVSEGIKGVITAFGKGDVITGILETVAVVASVATIIQSLNSAIGTIPGYAEGVSRLQGKGSQKSDSIPAMLSRDEGVLKAEHNKEMDYAPNDIKVRRYKLGRAFEQQMLVTPNYASSVNYLPINNNQDLKPILEELKGLREDNFKLRKAIGHISATATIDEGGLNASITAYREKEVRRENKRG